MDIKNYLKSIDIDYRTISIKVEELRKKELTESEQAELEELENILKEKEEQITLHRD